MRAEIREQRAMAIQPYSGRGFTLQEVSVAVGMTPITIMTYANLFGFDFATGSKSKRGCVFQSRTARATKAKLEQAANSGKTRQQASDELSISLSTVAKYAEHFGINFRRPSIVPPSSIERAEIMASMFQSGKTLDAIGKQFSVSRERVRQIITRHHGLTAVSGGQHFHAIRRAKEVAEAKAERHHQRFGCTWGQHKQMIKIGEEMMSVGVKYARTPCGAWTSQRSNAIKRGIAWSINLWDWWQVWVASGKWEHRGVGKGKYVMCRFADNGDYAVGNVYIATSSHNAKVQPNNRYRKNHPEHHLVAYKLQNRKRRGPNIDGVQPNGLPSGISFKSGKYQAIYYEGSKQVYLGVFPSVQEAHEARLKAVVALNERAAA